MAEENVAVLQSNCLKMKFASWEWYWNETACCEWEWHQLSSCTHFRRIGNTNCSMFLCTIFVLLLNILLLKVNRFVASNATVTQIQDVRRKWCQHIYRSTVRKHRKLRKESNTRYAVKRCNSLKFRSMGVSANGANENTHIQFIRFHFSSSQWKVRNVWFDRAAGLTANTQIIATRSLASVGAKMCARAHPTIATVPPQLAAQQ